MIVPSTKNKKAISETNNMRGIIKVTFGQCIKTMIKAKHQ